MLTWLSRVCGSLHHRSEGEGYLPGSGSWLVENKEFIHWRESSSSTLLWVRGIPGSGKTKLVYKIIQTILDDSASSPNHAPVAYFYCTRNPAEPERSSVDEIMRNILKQLAVTAQGSVKDLIVEEFRRRDLEAEAEGVDPAPLRLSEAKKLILELLEKDPATIIIDALDECDPANRNELLVVLDDIIKDSPSLVKVIVASRDDGDICCHLTNSPNIYIRADDNRQDIERFIEHSLAKAISSGKLLAQ